MSNPTDDKYRETIETIFRELTPDVVEADTLEPLLQPLRIYVSDIARFHTDQIFTAKLRKFLEARDRIVTLTRELEDRGLLEEAGKYQQEVNKILDQVLDLLAATMKDSSRVHEDLDVIIRKVEEAKALNTIRALGELVIEAGRAVQDRQHSIRHGLEKLTEELARCKSQIEDLECRLEDTRINAELDHLTKLRNRRAFDRDLTEAINRAHRFENPLCLLLLDLDNFKEINDAYGHLIGDDVLVNFARLLETSLRDFDLTYRIGGDEFAVLFSGCSLERAHSVGERVRKYLADNRYRVDGHVFTLTISGGLVDLAEGETAAALYKRADEQLYAAKKEGRDRLET